MLIFTMLISVNSLNAIFISAPEINFNLKCVNSISKLGSGISSRAISTNFANSSQCVCLKPSILTVSSTDIMCPRIE